MKLLEEIKKEAVLKAFIELNGNKTSTAKALGIGLRTLHRNLDTYGVRGGRGISISTQLKAAAFLLSGREEN
jgi:DNA-binding NtrC family response regulator